MMLDNGEKAIRVKRDELLATLKKNRTAHRGTFKEAMKGYRERAIAELDASLQDAKEGRRIRRAIDLVEPMNQTKEYNRAIKMLEMTVDEVVTIGETEFSQYVMDDWHWKSQFNASSMRYITGPPGPTGPTGVGGPTGRTGPLDYEIDATDDDEFDDE